MACPETLRTQAYLDGEAHGAEAAAAERHIEGCADCQAFAARAAELSDALTRQASRHRAPEALRQRVLAALDGEEVLQAGGRTAPPRAVRRSFWRGVLGGALGGTGLTGLIAALVVVAVMPPSPSTLAGSAIDAHTRALMTGREIAVVSSDHHTVKPWFAGRVALSPPVTDFKDQGFPLVGGRLDRVGGARAATVVYRHGAHRIDLFVWADRGGALPADSVRHGYRALFWKAGDLDFAAVSDVQAGELARFRELVRTQPE